MTHHQQQAQSQELETLCSLIEGFENAMLITHGEQQTLHARPMAIARFEAPETIWFITSAESVKVEEVDRDRRAAVTLQDGQRFVALSGRAAVSPDSSRLREYWSPLVDVWFDDGPDDPRAVLVRFDADEAEYWDGSGLKGLRFAVELAKAAIKGQTIETERDARAHAQLSL